VVRCNLEVEASKLDDCGDWYSGVRERPVVSVRENVCNNSKNVKSHVFWILRKTLKNVRTVSETT